jgi:hypothetical protein
MQVRIDHIGEGRSPVVVIDDAWSLPNQLVDMAAARTDFSARSLYYPGVRSSAPADYSRALISQLNDLILQTFALAAPLAITDSTFSILATPAANLVGFQRVPHFDSPDPNRIAVLHYLCGPEHGGTAFYRHRSSGIEAVTEDNRDHYIKLVNLEVKANGMPPARFIDDDTTLFQRIARYDCAFNRALIYRGNLLHSVNTPAAYVPNRDARAGRLTVNTFLLAGGTQSPVQ